MCHTPSPSTLIIPSDEAASSSLDSSVKSLSPRLRARVVGSRTAGELFVAFVCSLSSARVRGERPRREDDIIVAQEGDWDRELTLKTPKISRARSSFHSFHD